MNRKVIVSVLAIILVITMIFSLLLSVIPRSAAAGAEGTASAAEYNVQQVQTVTPI